MSLKNIEKIIPKSISRQCTMGEFVTTKDCFHNLVEMHSTILKKMHISNKKKITEETLMEMILRIHELWEKDIETVTKYVQRFGVIRE